VEEELCCPSVLLCQGRRANCEEYRTFLNLAKCPLDMFVNNDKNEILNSNWLFGKSATAQDYYNSKVLLTILSIIAKGNFVTQ
jgi:hypothetical protein